MLYALHRYLKYFAILGLVPWAKKGPKQRLQKIYTIVLISVNIGLACFIVVYSPGNEGDLLVSLLVSCIVFVSQIVTMTVIEVQIMSQYDKFYELCFLLKCLRIRFQCDLQQPIKGLPWSRSIKFFIQVILNIATVSVSIYVVHYYIYIGYFWYSLGALLINRFQCLLLLLYVEILNYHVELLDLRLQAVYTCRLLGTHSLLDIKCAKICSLEYLLSLKRVYMELYRLYDHFNGLFGWSILFIFVVMFLDAMINIYWTMLIMGQVYDIIYIYMTFPTFVPLLVLLFTFCHCGEHCKRQHMLIGSHVRGLACSSQNQEDSPPQACAYNAVLAEFAIQVEQDALIISAEGFMNIDYSLLMSIFTAMVTYLIVLMQFGSL